MSTVAPFQGKNVKSPKSLPNFSRSSSDEPDPVLMVGAVIGLGITSIQYARWLNTPLGRQWDTQHTWFCTVLGVMLTLAWLAVHDPKAAVKSFAFFMVSGTPIVIRALSNHSATLETYINREKEQSGN